MARTSEELDIQLNELQNESWNNGGYFRFLTIKNEERNQPVQVLKNYVALPSGETVNEGSLRIQEGMKNLRLLIIDDWEKTTREKLVAWFQYQGPCPPDSVDAEKLENLLVKFMSDLKNYLIENNLQTTYLVGEHGEYGLYGSYLPWGDHMNCDIIFEIDRKIHILHLGFSS
jgi:hypothetical protein